MINPNMIRGNMVPMTMNMTIPMNMNPMLGMFPMNMGMGFQQKNW